jgi:hypothetical protein
MKHNGPTAVWGSEYELVRGSVISDYHYNGKSALLLLAQMIR